MLPLYPFSAIIYTPTPKTLKGPLLRSSPCLSDTGAGAVTLTHLIHMAPVFLVHPPPQDFHDLLELRAAQKTKLALAIYDMASVLV